MSNTTTKAKGDENHTDFIKMRMMREPSTCSLESTTSTTSCSSSSSDDHHHPDTANNTPSTIPSQKRVSFTTIEIIEFYMIPGDHPECKYGPAVQLSWETTLDAKFRIPTPLEEYEELRELEKPRRTKRQLYLSITDRKRIVRRSTAAAFNDNSLSPPCSPPSPPPLLDRWSPMKCPQQRKMMNNQSRQDGNENDDNDTVSAPTIRQSQRLRLLQESIPSPRIMMDTSPTWRHCRGRKHILPSLPPFSNDDESDELSDDENNNTNNPNRHDDKDHDQTTNRYPSRTDCTKPCGTTTLPSPRSSLSHSSTTSTKTTTTPPSLTSTTASYNINHQHPQQQTQTQNGKANQILKRAKDSQERCDELLLRMKTLDDNVSKTSMKLQEKREFLLKQRSHPHLLYHSSNTNTTTTTTTTKATSTSTAAAAPPPFYPPLQQRTISCRTA